MYSAWARRRRNRFLAIVFLLLVGIGVAAFFVFSTKQATCFDGEQNQNERGIDCGGKCSLVCSADTVPLRLQWVRAFRVASGWWSALAYIENANPEMYAENIPYKITLYDDSGFRLEERIGEVSIHNEVVVPVYWGRIFLPADRTVYRATFEWLQEPEWQKATEFKSVRIAQQRYATENGILEVHAVLVNEEHVPLTDVTVYVVAYNSQDNAVAVSQTVVPELAPLDEKPISFVWQEPLTERVSRIEIIPRIPLQQ